MKYLLLLVGVGIGVYYINNSLSKKKKKKNKNKYKEQKTNETNTNQEDKKIIFSKLNELRNKSLENLINYEITFLTQTELEDYKSVDKIYQKYPKTLSKISVDFLPIYQDFESALVDECILEILESNNAKDYNADIKEPFLRFEYFIKDEAKQKARKLFDDQILNIS